MLMTAPIEQSEPDDGSDTGDLFDSGGNRLSDHVAERQLLGYLLHKPGAVTETMEILRPVDLHDPLHRLLYELLIRSYEADTPPTMEAMVASLGGEKSAGVFIATLMGHADLGLDAAELADHLQGISERRAVGAADDIDFHRGAPFVSKFGAQAWEDIGLAGAAKTYAWLVEFIVPLGEITLAFGDPGSGKSFNMFDMSMCVARGIKFNSSNVEPGLVVYVAAEAGKGFAKRKTAYVLQHKLEASEPLPFVLLTKRPNFFHDDSDALALIEEIAAISRRYQWPLVCIVIDTLSALAPGMNENASQDVSLVRKRLVMLQDKFAAAIVLVHHKPKNGTTPRGHGSLTGDFETTIEFETLGDHHRATVRKQREGKSGAFWEFTLPVIEVGRNKWGNPETSCVVEPYQTGAAAKAGGGFHATPNELLFMRALYDALIDHAAAPPAGLPAAITRVVEQRHVRALMRDRTIAPHEDSNVADGRFRTAFSRAGAKLRDGGVIGVQGALLWATGKPVNGLAGPA